LGPKCLNFFRWSDVSNGDTSVPGPKCPAIFPTSAKCLKTIRTRRKKSPDTCVSHTCPSGKPDAAWLRRGDQVRSVTVCVCEGVDNVYGGVWLVDYRIHSRQAVVSTQRRPSVSKRALSVPRGAALSTVCLVCRLASPPARLMPTTNIQSTPTSMHTPPAHSWTHTATGWTLLDVSNCSVIVITSDRSNSVKREIADRW